MAIYLALLIEPQVTRGNCPGVSLQLAKTWDALIGVIP